MEKLTTTEIEEIFLNIKEDFKCRKILYHYFKNQDNFQQFCTFVLPDAFSAEFADFHSEIELGLFNDENFAVAEPRGHGKSTHIGQGFVIYNILYEKEPYIIYTSQNHEKSIAFLEPITRELKNNKIIQLIWGYQHFVKGKDEETGRDREDCYDIKSKIRVQALSFEKNIRGLKYGNQRPTLIILDDIEDDERVLNPDLRHKDANKLNKQIIPAMDTKGKYKMIGTILHHDSLLMKKVHLLGGKIYRACELSEKEKITFKGRLFPKIIEGSLIFPELITNEFLYGQMYELGSTCFSSEYLNNPIDDTASLIKREWVRACFDEEYSFGEVDKYDLLVQGVDFAFSDRITADKSAFLGVGKRVEGYFIVQCITKKGLSITQQFDYIEYLTGVVGYTDNALEENSMRSMSDDLKEGEDGEKRWNFPYTLFWTAASDSPTQLKSKPEWEQKRHTIGKISMIKRLATQFENKNISIPFKTDKDKEIAHAIMDECCTYALSDGKLVEVGVHGDIPVALSLAIERCEMEVMDADIGVLEL